MTVSTTTRKQQFPLDGVDTAFTFTFRALTAAPSDIKCIVTDGDGNDTDLAYTTDYSVAINSNGVGGTVTLVDAAAVGAGTLTVYRDTTNTQESDYDDYNQFPADTLENDLDIRTLVAQEREEELDRTLRLPISVAGVDAQLPVPVADNLIGWSPTALGLVNIANVESGELVVATGSTTGRSLASRFADVANVLDYGAVGDGATDDTTAIQAAIDSGRKVVYLPQGSYDFSTTLDIPEDVSFIGADTEITILTYTGTGKALSLSLASSKANSARIANFALNCTGGATDGIYLKNSQHTKIEKVYLDNWSWAGDDGIHIDDGCHHVIVEDCRIFGGASYGINITQGVLRCNACIIKDTYAWGKTAIININDCSDTQIIGCKFNQLVAPTTSNILLTDVTYTSIIGCYFEPSVISQTIPFIKMAGACSGLTVSNSYLGISADMSDANSSGGIIVDDTSDFLSVIGSYFYGNTGGIPIRLESGTNHYVVGNRCSANMLASGIIKVTSATGAERAFIASGILQVGADSVVEDKTGDYAVTLSDSGKTFTNKGASDTIRFTLPAAQAGLRYTFVRSADEDVKITAAAGDYINFGTTGKTFENATGAERMKSCYVEAIDGLSWIVRYEGTWVNNNTDPA